MELMNENIELNTPEITPREDEPVSGEGSSPEAQSACVTFSARTLDWDEPLPAWVTKDHPDIIMYVQL